MKAFYILKPDAILRAEVIKEYNQIIKSQNYISNRNQYQIDSWIDLSCLLYEPTNTENIKETIRIKRQLLTTIKCYDYLFNNKPAVIDIFDIPEDIELLQRLEKIKYLLRKKYVINTDKNYIRFNNLSEEEICKKLKEISISDLDISHIRLGCDEELDIPGYNLAYINCIHTPDPIIESVQKDLEVIEKSMTLKRKINL